MKDLASALRALLTEIDDETGNRDGRPVLPTDMGCIICTVGTADSGKRCALHAAESALWRYDREPSRPVVETMTRIPLLASILIARVWRGEPLDASADAQIASRAQVRAWVEGEMKRLAVSRGLTLLDLAKAFAALERVSAVEVVAELDGAGVVHYVDWP